jgi:hypothetical protein
MKNYGTNLFLINVLYLIICIHFGVVGSNTGLRIIPTRDGQNMLMTDGTHVTVKKCTYQLMVYLVTFGLSARIHL